MSDETTLLPCPFCGGEAHISDDYSSKRGMVYSVWHDCPAGGGYHPYGQGVGVLQVTSAWFSSREEAIAAWNTRAELVDCGICKFYHADIQLCEYGIPPCSKFERRAVERVVELGSGTCEVECFDDGTDEGMDGELFSYAPPTWYLSCGHTAQGTEMPNFCPNCGARIRKAVER